MARLRALGLVASVILVLLCQSGSEAVRLAPTTPTTATPGNATASGGNAATSKPAGDPKGKTFHIVLGMGAEWGKRSKTTDYDTIVFENGGYIEVKRLYRFPSEEAYKKCNYKGATLLAKFQAAGEKYRYAVPYSAQNDYMYFGPSPWICKVFGATRIKIPVLQSSG